MKKFLVFITVLALIAFAGCAFATTGIVTDPVVESEPTSSGGHINPAANVNTDPAADYEPTSSDVTATGATATLVDYNLDTPDGFDAADIYLPTETTNKVAVMTNVRINLTGYEDAPVTIHFANYTDTRTSDLYAFIKANYSLFGYIKGKFYNFPCTVSGNSLSFTVDNPGVFFSENTVVLATAKTVSSSGGGGCNTGYAGLLLLAAVPFFFRKK